MIMYIHAYIYFLMKIIQRVGIFFSIRYLVWVTELITALRDVLLLFEWISFVTTLAWWLYTRREGEQKVRLGVCCLQTTVSFLLTEETDLIQRVLLYFLTDHKMAAALTQPCEGTFFVLLFASFLCERLHLGWKYFLKHHRPVFNNPTNILRRDHYTFQIFIHKQKTDHRRCYFFNSGP